MEGSLAVGDWYARNREVVKTKTKDVRKLIGSVFTLEVISGSFFLNQAVDNFGWALSKAKCQQSAQISGNDEPKTSCSDLDLMETILMGVKVAASVLFMILYVTLLVMSFSALNAVSQVKCFEKIPFPTDGEKNSFFISQKLNFYF